MTFIRNAITSNILYLIQAKAVENIFFYCVFINFFKII